MKKLNLILFSLLALGAVFQACDDSETYAEKLSKERRWIRNFIASEGINVISEDDFYVDTITNTDNNEYVYFDDSGVYMQIMERGNGELMEDGEHWELMLRYTEISVETGDTVLTNIYTPAYLDIMMCTKSGTSYSASFTESNGLMYASYGQSVPTGWLIPLDFIKPNVYHDGDISRVRLIVPHSSGHSIASSYVTPYFYEITYQKKY